MRKNDKIEVLLPDSDDETWYEATIIEPLSAQFLCHLEGNRRLQHFYFYKDKGTTWKEADATT